MTTECEFCHDPAHTANAHRIWLEWHNDLVAGRVSDARGEPPLKRSNTIDPRETRDE